jgi:hypothetical protein
MAQYSPPKPNPVDVQIIVDEPTHGGEYSQSDNLKVIILYTNKGAEETNVHFSFWVKYIRADSSHSVADNTGDQVVQPGKSFNYTFNRPYPAGLWEIYATGGMVNGTGPDVTVTKYFTTLTEQELFNKQALQQSNQFNIILALLGGASAAVALGAAISNHRHNNRMLAHTKEYNDEALKHTKEYTKAQLELMQESNELTKSQLKLRDQERKFELGEPDIDLVNYGTEFSGSSPNLSVYPNFVNRGKVDARNIKIHYKVFNKVVGLDEIVKHESEIMQNIIEIDGSIGPGQPKNIHTANVKNPAITWQRRSPPITHSVAIWYTYDYLENEHGEVLYNVQFTDTSADNKPTRYTKIEIDRARAKRDGVPFKPT